MGQIVLRFSCSLFLEDELNTKMYQRSVGIIMMIPNMILSATCDKYQLSFKPKKETEYNIIPIQEQLSVMVK